MPDLKQLSDDDFIALQEHRRAIEEEYANLALDPNDTPDEVRLKTRKWAVHNLENALKRVITIMQTSDKEAIQLQAAKFVVSIAKETSPKDDDENLAQLFKAI